MPTWVRVQVPSIRIDVTAARTVFATERVASVGPSAGPDPDRLLIDPIGGFSLRFVESVLHLSRRKMLYGPELHLSHETLPPRAGEGLDAADDPGSPAVAPDPKAQRICLGFELPQQRGVGGWPLAVHHDVFAGVLIDDHEDRLTGVNLACAIYEGLGLILEGHLAEFARTR